MDFETKFKQVEQQIEAKMNEVLMAVINGFKNISFKTPEEKREKISDIREGSITSAKGFITEQLTEQLDELRELKTEKKSHTQSLTQLETKVDNLTSDLDTLDRGINVAKEARGAQPPQEKQSPNEFNFKTKDNFKEEGVNFESALTAVNNFVNTTSARKDPTLPQSQSALNFLNTAAGGLNIGKEEAPAPEVAQIQAPTAG